MLSKQEENELTNGLKELRQNAVLLRKELNLIDGEKEAAFENREMYSKEIDYLIKKVMSLRSERNRLISIIKEDKAKREALNSNCKENIRKLRDLKESQRAFIKKYKIKDPSEIKEAIEKLEYKLETEAFPFEKEQELVKKVKYLKKKKEEARVLSDVQEGIKKASGELNILKSDSDFIHQKIQSRAAIAQKKHEESITLSKKIDELRQKEMDCQQKFLRLKEKFNSINNSLKEKLTELNKLNQELRTHVQDKKKIKEDIIREKLKSKGEVVQDKIKRGEKLTTEDILIFQRTELNEEPDRKDQTENASVQ